MFISVLRFRAIFR